MTKHSLTKKKESSHALVLLSGGMDSVAALHWAREKYAHVAGVAFWYGQPHHREVDVARILAGRHGVPVAVFHLCEAIRGHEAISPPSNGRDGLGVSKANLPGRNLTLLSVAAAHAMRLWPGELVRLVIGCNLDDAAAFPDCRSSFIDHAEGALDAAMRGIGGIRVEAPWSLKNKADILKWCVSRPDALADVRDSLSCYRGTRCGECDACLVRARAFEAAGLEDGTGVIPASCGGDPHRDAKIEAASATADPAP